MKRINWIAVQPTPYNKSLFDAIIESDLFDLKLYYSDREFLELPFKEELKGPDDYFFNKILGVDWYALFSLSTTRDWVIVAGWNDLTKLLVILIRGLLARKTAFWTDSLDVDLVLSNRPLFLFKKIISRNFKIFFTTGKMGIENIKQIGLIRDKTRLINLPYFIDIPSNYKSINIIHECLEIVMIARLISRKGIDIALRAILELKKMEINVRLRIAGTGELYDQSKKFIEENSLESYIILLGWVDHEEVGNLLMSSNLLIHPVVEHDPYGVVVIEALSYGLPVIGSNLAGAVIDRIVDGSNGYAICANSMDLVQSMLKCIKLKDLTSMSIAARQSSLDSHPIKGVQILLNELY